MNIFLADDDKLLAESVQVLLSHHGHDVDIFADLYGLCEALNSTGAGSEPRVPDIILLDLRMPGMNGVAGVKKIIDQAPSSRIVVLSGSASAADSHKCLELGVHGFLTKGPGADYLLDALKRVGAGEIVEQIADAKVRLTRRPGTKERVSNRVFADTLSYRHYEVLSLAHQGMSNKDIALALGLSENTIKTHMKTLLAKFHVKNRVQLLRVAEELGLIKDVHIKAS